MDDIKEKISKFFYILKFFLFFILIIIKIETSFCQQAILVFPDSYEFGGVNIGESSEIEIYIKNYGPELTINSINLLDTYNYDLDEGVEKPCGYFPRIISENDYCTVIVRFKPESTGFFRNWLTLSFDNGTASASFEGVGNPNITVTPVSKDFGNKALGTSTTQIFTISNMWTEKITILDITLSDTTNYSLNLNEGDQPCGTTNPILEVGGTCTFSITFHPQSNGIFNAILTISSDAFGTTTYNTAISGSSGAQGQTWVKSYTSNYSYGFPHIQQTFDGGYIMGGTTRLSFNSYDLWVMKVDRFGNIEWQKTYGGSSYDFISSIKQTSDGGYIVLAETYSFGAGSEDIWIFKLNSNGEIEWQKTYGGSGYESASSIEEDLYGYIVAGNTESNGINNVWIMKLDQNGSIQWQKTYGISTERMIATSIQKTNGGFIIAGIIGNPVYYSTPYLLQINQDGNVFWAKKYWYTEFDNHIIESLITLSSGNYLLVGRNNRYSSEMLWVMEVNAIDGSIIWQKTYGGQNVDFGGPFTAQEAHDGGYIIAGSIRHETSDYSPNVWILKLNKDGSIGWQKTYGGKDVELPGGRIIKTQDGGYAVASRNDIYGYGANTDLWLYKLDSYGNISNCPNASIGITNEVGITTNKKATDITSNIIVNDTLVTPGTGGIPIISTPNFTQIDICMGETQYSTSTNVENIFTFYSQIDQALVLNATVTSTGGTVNEGTVTFTVKRNGSVIGFPVTSGIVSGDNAYANYTLPGGTIAGTYTIEAAYSGGTVFLPSTGTGELIISKANTNTSVDSNPNPSKYGQKITLIATVNPSTATGTVQFK
ncbi:MAG: choice-of-anchor D domain-containing protein, partial [Thermoplasmata archaeon]